MNRRLRLLPLLMVLALWLLPLASARAQQPEAEADADAGTETKTETDTATAPSCANLLAAASLEADERARLEALLCPDPGSTASPPTMVTLGPILRELITSGNWTAVLALEAVRASGVEPQQEQAVAARRALATLLANPRCTDLHEFLEQQIDQALVAGAVSSPRSPLARAPRACTAGVDPADLAALDGVVLIGYYGPTGDVFEAVTADPSPAHISALTHASARGLAQLLVVPKGAATVVFVRERGLELPWRRHLAPDHGTDFALTPQAKAECLKIEFAAANDGQTWQVVVDGIEFAIQPESAGSYALGRLDLVDIPPGAHEVHFIQGDRDRGHEHVETTGSRKTCAMVEADLRGLTPGYGMTRLVIDDRCRERGLVPAQVRKLAERYFANNGIELRQLDVIVDILASFAVIESNLGSGIAVGSNKLEASTEHQLSSFSGELLRQGVAKLMTLSASCADDSEDMVIVGQIIDLERFSQRERSRAAGVDVSEILEARTAIVQHRNGRRQGFEEVLGGLLGLPTVHLEPVPAAVNFQDTLELSYRVDRGQQPQASFEFGVALVERESVCSWADDLSTLASFDNQALLSFIADRPGKVVRRDRHDSSNELDGDGDGDDDLGSHDLTVERTAPFSGPGRYLVWVREIGEGGTEVISAACFEVDAHDMVVFAQFGGLTSSRPGPLWVERVYSFRFDVGVLYPIGDRGFGRFGGQVGYSNTNYDNSALPSWNDINAATVGSFGADGTLHLEWTRHALTFAGIGGFDIPLGPCGYPFRSADIDDPEQQARLARLSRRCAKSFHRRWSFTGRFMIGGSFGFHDLSSLSGDLSDISTRRAGSTIISDFDLDVGVQLGFFARLSKRAGVYVYHQLNVNDLDSQLNGDVEPDGAVTNDFAVLNLLGVGIAWTRKIR